MLRRYWQPAALVEELAGERAVRPVRLMGEDLVLFRDERGRHGLLGRQCPHRGADLCYGRLEDGGLRCAFHGWLWDTEGRCQEMPAEPPGSTFPAKVRHTAYPCEARNGIVFAYLGPGTPPPLPEFDCFAAPERFTFAFKGLIEANWLQALEVGIDPAHASFLHRFFEDEDPAEGYGQQFRAPTSDSGMPVTKLMREYDCPRIEVDETGYGLRIFALRQLDAARMHVRVTNLMFPNAIVIPLSNDMMLTQWHVPINDESSWWYAIFSAYSEPVDKETMRNQRLELYTLPDYAPRLNRANHWGYDPSEQRGLTYTGMGLDINVHDNWAVESPGPIQDRTAEHLGASDKAIIANRKLLMRAIEQLGKGEEMPIAPSGNGEAPVGVDTIGAADNWRTCWADYDRARRAASAWAAGCTFAAPP